MSFTFQIPLRRMVSYGIVTLSDDPELRARQEEEGRKAMLAAEEWAKGAVLQGLTDLEYVLQEYEESEPVLRIMWKNKDLGIVPISQLKRIISYLENPEILKTMVKKSDG